MHSPTSADQIARTVRRRAMAHGAQRAGLTLGVLALTIGSAIFAKELTGPARPIEPLAQLAAPAAPAPHEPTVTLAVKQLPAFDLDVDALSQPPASSDPTTRSTGADEAPDASLGQIRWFDGRPVRAARTIMLRVTAYSPDERSCGIFADGQTATLHSVWTNGFQLVAADTRLLPFGSLLTVPGYADDKIVPVLDRGGAIKGHRLDVLFPTHREAMKWGVRDVPVIVWEYADGQPAGDPRRKR